jgi:hypothetical protein
MATYNTVCEVRIANESTETRYREDQCGESDADTRMLISPRETLAYL